MKKLLETHWFVDGEGAPQRHQPAAAVAADEALVMEDAVALVGLKHPRTPKRQVDLLSGRSWKPSEKKPSLKEETEPREEPAASSSPSSVVRFRRLLETLTP